MKKILFSWSGGKDSAIALHEVQQSGEYEIVSLLTTITQDYDRISMHGVRRVLLEEQARTLDIPLHQIWISPKTTNEEYESKMSEAMNFYKTQGVDTVAFGDLFLEDIRNYRDEKLSLVGMKGLYPVWERDTKQFIKDFLSLGFKAILTCIDPRKLDKEFAGRIIDENFIADLPDEVDPCGENGEFHTFVFAAPNFKHEIEFEIGEKVLRDGFYFCDLQGTQASCLP